MYPYRGRTPNGHWVWGYYFAAPDLIRPNLIKHYILNGESKVEVQQETVGMRAETTDMHGNTLHEDDVVAYRWNPGCPPINMVIRLKEDFFLMEPAGDTCPYHQKNKSTPCKAKSCEVWSIRLSGESKNIQLLGNIYDSPHLMDM